MTGTTGLRCAACGESLHQDDRFCERCGAPLTGPDETATACPACGTRPLLCDPDGYCSVCGARPPTPEDRSEIDLSVAAVTSDRGRVHRRNEDAFFLALAGRGGAAVVCDGISSASAGNIAARRAADAAGAVLVECLEAESPELPQAMDSAAEAAQDAVASVPWTTRIGRDTPSCTLVAAVWHEAQIAVGWLGDSRAYWVDGAGARQLTIDDSWAREQAAEGRLSFEQAMQDPRAHSITHWVGADAPRRASHVAVVQARGRGRLLLCTDGLWNYAPTPDHIAGLIDALPSSAAPAAVARALTDTALTRGGRDNITVAVIDIDLT